MDEGSYNPLADVTNQHQLTETTADESSLLSSGATYKQKTSMTWDEELNGTTSRGSGNENVSGTGSDRELDETAPEVTTSVDEVKKSLFYEEEFRTINQAEPIHIFLKLKPVEEADMKKQNNQVYNH